MTRKVKSKTKFIFVTGGIISGIGKGLTVASLGRLLISHGFSVFPIKADPYLNEDAGIMNPYQHGEVFVTDDGAETDLDLGHYERFMSLALDKRSNFTSGSVFRAVLDKERQGKFLGKTIQFVPHLTNEIQERILSVARQEKPDFIIVEVGGTVGADMEVQPFLESIRQIALKVGRQNCAFLHVVKMDYVFPSDEEKTKPIQHSVQLMRGTGISPDILVVRAKRSIDKKNLEKIALFCGVRRTEIIEALNAENIYEIPLNLQKAGLLKALFGHFGMSPKKREMGFWKKKLKRVKFKKVVKIAIVGKYHNHPDAYISLNEALRHAAILNQVGLEIMPVDSEGNDMINALRGAGGIVVAGGYGARGMDGKVKAIEFARVNKIPFLGLCLGLQAAVVEFSRNVLGWKNANSAEMDKNRSCPVIDLMSGQKLHSLGGTQRLGAYPAYLKKGTKTWKIYQDWHWGSGKITERHRHRYEVNPRYHSALSEAGLVLSGTSQDGLLVEFIELSDDQHPFFVATQAHPEFKSQFLKPHPLFDAFVKVIK